MLRSAPFLSACTACGAVILVPGTFHDDDSVPTCQCGECYHWMAIEAGRLQDLAKDQVAFMWENEEYRAHVLEAMAEVEKKYWG